MSEKKKVIILGGHGKIALQAAPKLVASGVEVHSVIRNPEHSEEVEQAGAQAVVLDIESASTSELAEVFHGADAVIYSAGAGGGNPARTRAVDQDAAIASMDAALQAGVGHYVMVSYARSQTDIDTLDESNSFYPYAAAKHHADNYLRDSGLVFTVLGPGRLTSEPASGLVLPLDRAGKAAEGDVDTSTSRENVAEVIAYVVKHGAAANRTVNFVDGTIPLEEVFGP